MKKVTLTMEDSLFKLAGVLILIVFIGADYKQLVCGIVRNIHVFSLLLRFLQ